MARTLTDADMLTSRRGVIKSFAAKTGLVVTVAAVIASSAVLTASPAAASDRHNQTDHDTGEHSDYVGQTDHD